MSWVSRGERIGHLLQNTAQCIIAQHSTAQRSVAQRGAAQHGRAPELGQPGVQAEQGHGHGCGVQVQFQRVWAGVAVLPDQAVLLVKQGRRAVLGACLGVGFMFSRPWSAQQSKHTCACWGAGTAGIGRADSKAIESHLGGIPEDAGCPPLRPRHPRLPEDVLREKGGAARVIRRTADPDARRGAQARQHATSTVHPHSCLCGSTQELMEGHNK